MASISIHVNDEVIIDKMKEDGIRGGWPLLISVQSFCGEGEYRSVYSKDAVHLHGEVADFRRFANAILAALPVEDAQPAPEAVEYAEVR